MSTDANDGDKTTVPLDHQIEDGPEVELISAPSSSTDASVVTSVSPAPHDVFHPEQSSTNQAENPFLASAAPAQPLESVVNPSAVPDNETTNKNATNPISTKKRIPKKLKVLLIALVGVLLLGGGGAAAYFGYVVPNQPENILKKAVENSLKQRQGKFSGTLEMKSASQEDESLSGLGTVEVEFSGKSDVDKGVAQVEMELAVAGVKIPAELRYVDKSIYMQVKNLQAVESIVKGFAPDAAPLVTKVSKTLSGQWIELDNTLLSGQGGGEACAVSGLSFTQADIDTLFEIYSDNQFATINKTTNEVRGSAGTIKYEISLDDNKMTAALKQSLKQVSVMKKLQECVGGVEDSDVSELADNDSTPIVIWVDKDKKQIIRFAMYSTPKDAKESDLEAKLEMDISDEVVTVEKPANSKSFLQIVAELQELMNDPVLLQLLGGELDDSTTETQLFSN